MILRTMMTSKIHRARITGADLHYVGSITIDSELMAAANLLPGQQVDVVDVTNGARLTTYAIPGEAGSGGLTINGAAAHLIHQGDLVIVIAYSQLSEEAARTYRPCVVFVDENNRPLSVGSEPGRFPGAATNLAPSGIEFAEYRASGRAGSSGLGG